MGNCSLRAADAAADDEDAVATPPPTPATSPSSGGSITSAANCKNGIWKVKLVIDPKDLEQVLSEGVNTEALIEQMRSAANSTPRRGIRSSWGRTVSYKFNDRI